VGAFIRICDEGKRFRVWMCPPKCIPKQQPKGHEEYRCWWADFKVIEMCGAIQARRNPVRLEEFVVGDDGEEI
jgi:hypothetical protein